MGKSRDFLSLIYSQVVLCTRFKMFKLALINDKNISQSFDSKQNENMKIRAEKRHDKKVMWHFVNYVLESVSLIPATSLSK